MPWAQAKKHESGKMTASITQYYDVRALRLEGNISAYDLSADFRKDISPPLINTDETADCLF